MSNDAEAFLGVESPPPSGPALSTYYLVAQTPNGTFVGQHSAGEIKALVKNGQIKPEYVVTESSGRSYNDVLRGSPARWISVTDLLTAVPPQLSDDAAVTVQSGTVPPPAESRETKLAAAQKNMLVGGLWCIGGIVVTAMTYQAAVSSPSGGTYFVAWGAILFGGIQFLKGLFQILFLE